MMSKLVIIGTIAFGSLVAPGVAEASKKAGGAKDAKAGGAKDAKAGDAKPCKLGKVLCMAKKVAEQKSKDDGALKGKVDALVKCDGKKDCMDLVKKGMSAAQKAKAAGGANKEVAEKMAQCAKSTEECKAEALKTLKNLKGRDFTKAELAGELRAAGSSAAGKSIKDCLDKASDVAAKKACMSGDVAKQAFAKASGRAVKDIKDVDLKKAARTQAMTDLKDEFDACVKANAADASEKKACMLKENMKKGIAAAMNVDAKSLKDSKVREYVAKAAQKELLTAVSSCDKNNVTKCKDLMRDIKAKAMGKAKSSVTDDDLEMDKRKAMRGDLADKMTACVDDAANDKKKIAECRQILAKATLKNGDLEGKEPSKGKIEKALRDAAKNTAKNVMKDCDPKDRKKCMDLSKERIQKAMGFDDISKVSNKMAEKLNKEGALEDVSQSALSCVRAKKENASSTCDDLYDKYLQARQKTKPNAAKAKTEKARVMMNAVGAQMKNVREVCFDKKTKSAADKCLKSFKTETDDLAKSILTGSAAKMQAKKKLAEAKATRDYLGDRFTACMRASTNNTEKMACKSSLEAKKVLAGVTAKKEDVLRRYSAKALAEAASLCGDSKSDRAACKKSAKDDFIKTSGMKARSYNAVKKIGEITSAAEVYAACLQENQTMATCDTQAKDEFLKVSGGDAKAWTAIKAKITKLGEGMNNGVDLVMKTKKQVSVDAHTNGATCQDAAAAQLLAMVKNVSMAKAHSGAKTKGCRVIDGKAEYSVLVGTKGFTDAEAEAAADKLSSAVTNATLARRLLGDSRFLSEGRRLVSVSSAYAAQDTELCASTDASCGVTEKDLGGEGGPSSASLASSAMREVLGAFVIATCAQMAWS